MSQNLEPIEILELFNKRALVIKPGLDRIKTALASLNNPGLTTPRIVVAGTNGKGSTSGIIWRMLAGSGLRVGLFSSPHLIEFRERITISDREVTNSAIIEQIHDIKSRLSHAQWDDLTFFEINTIVALMLFDHHQTDVNVLEIGLGGRLDCVNAYDPDVAVITSIGLDHQEYLGTTLTAIANEKAGVMRRGKPVIWSGLGSSAAEAHEAILTQAREIGACLIVSDFSSATFSRGFYNKPSFLKRNFSLACLAIDEFYKSFPQLNTKHLSAANLAQDFDRADWPWPVTLNGRFDLVEVSKQSHSQLQSRRVLLDVCHNPHGARALAQALNESILSDALLSEPVLGEPLLSHAKVPSMISILADKDAAGIWDEIKDKISDVIRFKSSSPRSWDPSDDRVPGPMFLNFSDAWNEALSRQDWQMCQPWLVFGSVAAIGEVLSFWQANGWFVKRVL